MGEKNNVTNKQQPDETQNVLVDEEVTDKVDQKCDENAQPPTTAAESEYPSNASEKLACPRCGKTFDAKEKACPYCGLKNELQLCKICGATIARSAERCPRCGAKIKKELYKNTWFWIEIVVAIFLCACVTFFKKGNVNLLEKTSVEEIVETPKPTATPTAKPTSTPRATKKPDAEKESPGSGRMITVSSEDKPVLGTWESYSYCHVGDDTVKRVSEDPQDYRYWKLELYSDNTGKEYIDYKNYPDASVDFDWEYIGDLDEKTRVYTQLDRGKATWVFFIVNGDSEWEKENNGRLAAINDNLILIFDKQ